MKLLDKLPVRHAHRPHSPTNEKQGNEVIHDAVFGDIDNKGPNFRGVGVGGAFVLMTKVSWGGVERMTSG